MGSRPVIRRTPHAERLLAATAGLLVLPLAAASLVAAGERSRPGALVGAAPVTSAWAGGPSDRTSAVVPLSSPATAVPTDDPSMTAARGAGPATTTTLGGLAVPPVASVVVTAPVVAPVSSRIDASPRTTVGSAVGAVALRPAAGPVTTTTPGVVPAPLRAERLSVGSVLRVLIAGFLLVALGLVAATWWFVRATRPVPGRRTV